MNRGAVSSSSAAEHALAPEVLRQNQTWLEGRKEAEALAQSEKSLASELAAARHLQSISTQLVMETLIKLDLGGKLLFDWRSDGLICEIEIQI